MSLKSLSKSLSIIALCSLASACGEEHRSTHPQALAPKAAKKVADVAPVQKALDMPLTATAPMAPRSILDGTKPSEAKPEAKATEAIAAQGTPTIDVQPEPDETADRPEQVKLDRFVLATDVLQREPVGESEHFTTETPKIFAFMQFANGQAPFAVKVYWEKVGDPASPYGVQLEVPTAARYRTWSWTKIRREPGTYRAVVRTLDGQELGSKEFIIEAASESAAQQTSE